jgi:hypothetical protein
LGLSPKILTEIRDQAVSKEEFFAKSGGALGCYCIPNYRRSGVF